MNTIKVKIFKQMRKDSNGKQFPTYYSYLLVETSKDKWEELKANINGQVKTLSTTTILEDKALATLTKDNNFPYILTLDDSDNSNDYHSYWKRDINTGKYVVTKDGSRILITRIYDFRAFERFIPPHKSMYDFIDVGDIDIREDNLE